MLRFAAYFSSARSALRRTAQAANEAIQCHYAFSQASSSKEGSHMHTASLQVARKALAQNVLFRRAQLRLSQTALCRRAGVSRSVISAIENEESNATLEILARVSNALEIDFAELIKAHVQEGDSEADIQRRARDGDDAFVDADDFIVALDDAAGERYSRAGRPRVAGAASS